MNETALDSVLWRLKEMIVAKNSDYGDAYKRNPFAQAETGLLIRIGDKMRRLETLAPKFRKRSTIRFSTWRGIACFF